MSAKLLHNLKGEKSDVSSLPTLPSSWCWSSLESLIQNFDGRRIPIKSDDRDKRTGPYPYYGASGIIDDIDDYIFDGEYLLIAEDGANLLSRSTPIAFQARGKFWVNNHAHIVQMRHDIPLAYLEFYLNGTNLQFFITGTAQPKLNQVNLNRIPVPVASLNEQRRIVSKIEELFSDLDAGVAALKRAKANLKRYRAAVLKAAVEGKLTEEWRAKHPHVEPASKLLARILTERRQKWESDQLAKFAAAGKEPPKGWKEKYVAPTAPDTTDLAELPDGWCWVRIDQLGDIQLGRQRSPKNRSDEFPTKYIRAANLTESGLNLTDILDMEFKPSELETYRLHPGDVLLSEASGSPDQVGKPVVWSGEIDDCCFQNTVIRLRPVGIPSEYPLTVFRHFYRSKLFAKVSAGVGINHLSAGKFSALPFPLAPLAEQKLIVLEVEERLSVIAVAENQLESNLLRAARLRQNILKQAFEGKLVPQDPNDEPASTLLARIKQLSTAATALNLNRAEVVETLPKEVFLRRASVVSYAIRRLASHRSFGRTQLEKTLHLTQYHLGVDLGFFFERYEAGPFDKSIYKLEAIAKKKDWFTTQSRPTFGVTYLPGTKIDEMCRYAGGYLGTKQDDLDQLLAHIGEMNTDQAELFATAYAAWNDMLIDGRIISDDAIAAEIYGWHEKKKKFSPQTIQSKLQWMREHGYVPTGQGQRTVVVSEAKKPGSRRRKPTT